MAGAIGVFHFDSLSSADWEDVGNESAVDVIEDRLGGRDIPEVGMDLVVGEFGQEDDVLFVDQQFPGTWIGERNFESVTASDGQNEFPVFSDSQPGIPEPAFDAEKYIKSSTRFL